MAMKTQTQLMLALFIILVAGILTYLLYTRREGFASQVTVTYFFMKGCPWCEKFKPEWAAFKNALTQQKLAVQTAEVDAEEKPDVVSKKNIRGFPTVLITGKDGKEVEYGGERTSAALLTEVKKHL